ncbi:hypothetical protein FBU59_006842 [Linderina macrospora]|uniref:Uncharacterized protein n=1 Tax=Linderina macrospora TaxID=4868 RepID=A0ACC1IYS5_9FUNG|nr:hypothetical protein FBU59_006842 [Linderina macrospora]
MNRKISHHSSQLLPEKADMGNVASVASERVSWIASRRRRLCGLLWPRPQKQIQDLVEPKPEPMELKLELDQNDDFYGTVLDATVRQKQPVE